ncbi:MAG: hypothetical protein R3E32_25055 [Chitinophagales bacterium]
MSSNDNGEDIFSKIFKDEKTLAIVKDITIVTHLPNPSKEDITMLITKIDETSLINEIVCYTEHYSSEMFRENEGKKENFRKLYHKFKEKYLKI